MSYKSPIDSPFLPLSPSPSPSPLSLPLPSPSLPPPPSPSLPPPPLPFPSFPPFLPSLLFSLLAHFIHLSQSFSPSCNTHTSQMFVYYMI